MRPESIWYRNHALGWLLLPLSWVFQGVVVVRRWAYLRGWLAAHRAGVPVIVVGNLTVGGTGKTPLVLWLVEWLRRRGHRPGVLVRGYRGRSAAWPRAVAPDSDPLQVGDEAVLLARRCGCPVAAGPDRVGAAAMLVADGGCDIIVSDDGLQHYRLCRDLEILVIDGQRHLGNRRCLPAGPLREPASRLTKVDLVVCHGADWSGAYRMDLVGERLVAVGDSMREQALAALRGQVVTAVAGVGNPDRFFARLRAAGLVVQEWPYPDHHPFSPADVARWPLGPVIMTEKDAVKCAAIAGADHWYLPVTARLETRFAAALSQRIEALIEWTRDC